jgi:hypothetical protein
MGADFFVRVPLCYLHFLVSIYVFTYSFVFAMVSLLRECEPIMVFSFIRFPAVSLKPRDLIPRFQLPCWICFRSLIETKWNLLQKCSCWNMRSQWNCGNRSRGLIVFILDYKHILFLSGKFPKCADGVNPNPHSFIAITKATACGWKEPLLPHPLHSPVSWRGKGDASSTALKICVIKMWVTLKLSSKAHRKWHF